MPSARTRSFPVPAGTTASARRGAGDRLHGGVHGPVPADGDHRARAGGDGFGRLPLGVGPGGGGQQPGCQPGGAERAQDVVGEDAGPSRGRRWG